MKLPYARVAGVVALFVVLVLSGISLKPPRAHADDDDTGSKIKIGFAIAPVPLNLAGKNRALVGLGSYIVNAQADCNGCHSAGPATEFARVATRISANRPRSIRRLTWAAAETLAPSPGQAHFRTSSRAI